MSLPCFPDDQLFLVFEEDFRFYKADAELPSASAAFQPEPRTTAASSSHEQGGGSTELVASGEPNSSQFWEETVGPRGEQRVHEFLYVSLVRLARKDVDGVHVESDDLVAICNVAVKYGSRRVRAALIDRMS